VLGELLRLVVHRGPYKGSRECLTPVLRDLPSSVPLGAVVIRALISPRSAVRLANEAIKRYSLTPDAIRRVVAVRRSVQE
jgi:hypothetical protein